MVIPSLGQNESAMETDEPIDGFVIELSVGPKLADGLVRLAPLNRQSNDILLLDVWKFKGSSLALSSK